MRQLNSLNGFIVSFNKGKIEVVETGWGDCYLKRRGAKKKEVILQTIAEFLEKFSNEED